MINVYSGHEKIENITKFWGGGEVDINFPVRTAIPDSVEWIYESKPNKDLEELIVLDELLGRAEVVYELRIPYMPYSRQDRADNPYKSNSLYALSKILNSLSYDQLVTHDIHNISTLNYFRDAINIDKDDIWNYSNFNLVVDDEYDYLVAPDAGAYKEVSKLGEIYNLPVFCASKTRDPNGPKINIDLSQAEGRGLVVDDICDGGRTFIELAKIAPKADLDLVVSHGLFTRGTEQLLKYYMNIYSFEYINAEINLKEY